MRKAALRAVVVLVVVVVVVLDWRGPCLVVVVVVVVDSARDFCRIATRHEGVCRGKRIVVLAKIAGHISSDSRSTEVRTRRPGVNPSRRCPQRYDGVAIHARVTSWL